MKAHDFYLKSYLLRNNWLAAYHDIIYDTMPALMTANKFYRNPENIYKAAQDIQKIFPNNPDAMFVLAKIYWKLGQPDKASEILQNTIESHPGYINGYKLLIQINESKNPLRAYEIATTALAYHPFNYQIRFQAFKAILKTAFKGMNIDDDKKHITLDEIKKVNKGELPEGRVYNIYKRIQFGFNENHFDRYDLNKDKMLDETEFIKLLAHYGVGPVERTKKTKDDEMTGVNQIADDLWHHALICYALQGIEVDEVFGEDISILKEFINADIEKLEEYYEYEKVYSEIVSDETLSDSYNINNPLSHLIIYWGLAKNHKGYKSVALQVGKRFLKKKHILSVTKPELPLKLWTCRKLNLFLYPDRSAESRFAQKDLPNYEFSETK
ncbi:MAG: tetratricopeptide repeat protein [Planctomycetes bacterium]|nr:tetratricopeptide repeat protein [Planctomycetota bacterium]